MDTPERLDDLASLFLPDIQGVPSSVEPKQEDFDIMDLGWGYTSAFGSDSNLSQSFNKSASPSFCQTSSGPVEPAPVEPKSYHHHYYTGFNPVETAMGQHPLYPGVQGLPQQQYSQMSMAYDSGFAPQSQSPIPSFMAGNGSANPPPPQPYHPDPPAEARRKVRRKEVPGASKFQFDYRAPQLRHLLDFKREQPSAAEAPFKIVDKDNNEVHVEFGGFLNGRFLTNDMDNSNYIVSRNQAAAAAAGSGPLPPRVISCYRRNYIQLSMNMRVSGIQSPSPLLRLQTSEYGYTITRVIKYFKLDISARTRVPNASQSVPIFIRDLLKETEREKKAQATEPDEDMVVPSQIISNEHIVQLNDESPVVDGCINRYFVIKQLQFKNATPNNGNLTFQNYYHLVVKLSAVVADLYYDDYMEEDGVSHTQGAADANTNEITLCELRSEPVIVRGRNPNFYADRKDVLIKGRSSLSKRSYRMATAGEAADDDDTTEATDPLHLGPELALETQLEPPPAPEPEPEPEPEPVANAVAAHSSAAHDPPSDPSVATASPLAQINHDTPDLRGLSRYNYFPISNVYYLPPINVVYIPHTHRSKEESVPPDSKSAPKNPAQPRERRKSSNVYFS
ncbi:hypothetical protein DICA1_D09890 [Diutina catenulata]